MRKKVKRYARTRILVEGDARIGRAMADDALAQMGEEAVSVVGREYWSWLRETAGDDSIWKALATPAACVRRASREWVSCWAASLIGRGIWP